MQDEQINFQPININIYLTYKMRIHMYKRMNSDLFIYLQNIYSDSHKRRRSSCDVLFQFPSKETHSLSARSLIVTYNNMNILLTT